jgi:hypothetical protein
MVLEGQAIHTHYRHLFKLVLGEYMQGTVLRYTDWFAVRITKELAVPTIRWRTFRCLSCRAPISTFSVCLHNM